MCELEPLLTDGLRWSLVLSLGVFWLSFSLSFSFSFSFSLCWRIALRVALYSRAKSLTVLQKASALVSLTMERE